MIIISVQVYEVLQNNEIELFQEIKGLHIIVISSSYGDWVDRMIVAPVHLYNYNQYWNWLFNFYREKRYCNSFCFDDFRKEVSKKSVHFLPSIREDYFEAFNYIRDLDQDDFNSYKNDFRGYFNSDLKTINSNIEFILSKN